MNYQNLLESLPDLVFIVDAEGTYLAWGGRKEGHFVDPASFVGKKMHELFPAAWADYHLSKVRKALETQDVVTYTFSLVFNEERWFESRVVPSRTQEKQVALFTRDVTDYTLLQRDLEERTHLLERSNAELANFAYVASHDLQEPLRTITSFLGIIQEEQGDLTWEAEEAMGFVTEAAARMKELIIGLLDYSRVDSQGASLQPVDLQQLVERVIHTTPTNGHNIRCDGLPVVRGDATQLGQVFQNLLGNAIKYRKPDSEADIHIINLGLKSGLHTLAIKDQGMGIDPLYFSQIFVIFKRLHTQQEYPGTGLGLAISKKIIERHGGTIWVESNPGEGATFFITLPEVRDAT